LRSGDFLLRTNLRRRQKNRLARRRERLALHHQIQLLPSMKEQPNEAANTADFEFSALAEARNYPRALMREFSPFLKGRVIEIGGGIGQMTTLLRQVPTIECLQCIEPDLQFCEQFKKTHPDQPLICGTIDNIPQNTDWDALFSVNVLEHIREDELELSKYK